MDNFLNGINNQIRDFVIEICSKISNEHNIDMNELIKLWNQKESRKKFIQIEEQKDKSPQIKSPQTKSPQTKSPQTKSPQTKTSPAKTPEKNVNGQCIYIFSRGARKGESCNSNVMSGTHCTKHKKYEKKEEKVEQLCLYFNTDIQKYIHKKTNLVFNKDKIVVGILKDKTIHDLSETEIDICKKNRFKYSELNHNTAKNLDEEIEAVNKDCMDYQEMLSALQN